MSKHSEQTQVKISDLKFNPEFVKLRPINVTYVSRYRQAMRKGVEFPIIIISKDKEIVSGNHRIKAMLDEFGDDHFTKVIVKSFKSNKDKLVEFAKENATHGSPLGSFSRKCITKALLESGCDPTEVANIFGLSIKRVEKIAGEGVVVVGTKSIHKLPEVKPVKFGPYVEGKEITEEQYEEHVSRDRGVTLKSISDQVYRWIRNDWVDKGDKDTMMSLNRLKTELDKFLN